jgi:hypothetical protein
VSGEELLDKADLLRAHAMPQPSLTAHSDLREAARKELIICMLRVLVPDDLVIFPMVDKDRHVCLLICEGIFCVFIDHLLQRGEHSTAQTDDTAHTLPR